MQSIKTRRSLLALGTASLALLPLSGAVQAQPRTPDYPAYDYPAQDNGRDSGYDDRDDVRDDDPGKVVTLQAVVLSRHDNTEFRVRAGRDEFDVRSTYNINVRPGDHVTLRGAFDRGHDFDASKVDLIGNGRDLPGVDDRYGDDYRPGRDGRVDFPGVITRVVDRDEFVVRGENERTYRVKTRSDYPRLRVGERLRVQGRTNGTSIYGATFVDFGRRGDDYRDAPRNDRQVDFPGRVIRLDRSRNEATVRGENGREYLVHGDAVDDVSLDQRVRVRGFVRDGIIDLTDLDRVR